MGQRAALLLSELLLLLAASRTLLAVSFPEDSVALDIVDAHCEYTQNVNLQHQWQQRSQSIAIIKPN